MFYKPDGLLQNSPEFCKALKFVIKYQISTLVSIEFQLYFQTNCIVFMPFHIIVMGYYGFTLVVMGLSVFLFLGYKLFKYQRSFTKVFEITVIKKQQKQHNLYRLCS